jgi:hypothetical protein
MAVTRRNAHAHQGQVSAAVKRFEDLRASYRKLVVSRRLSSEQRHQLLWAACLEQVREMAAIENAVTSKHSRHDIEQMRLEVLARLASAGAKINKEQE